MFRQRRAASRPPSLRPGGRHRGGVAGRLCEDAAGLVIAVPGTGTDLTSGAVADLLTIIRVDNPAVEVRGARFEAPDDDPEGIRAVLSAAAAARPDAPGPAAIVIPLIAAPHPPLVRKLRQAIADSGVNAMVTGFVNSTAMIAEALHIRLAEVGLARAAGVRRFSLVPPAHRILRATGGGPGAAEAAEG